MVLQQEPVKHSGDGCKFTSTPPPIVLGSLKTAKKERSESFGMPMTGFEVGACRG